MAKIVFSPTSAPGKNSTEGAGQLVNCYAEPLTEGAPSAYVVRRAPGTTLFCDTSKTAFRGSWFDGASTVYAAWDTSLYWIDANGTETLIGELLGANVTYINKYTDTSNLTAYTYAAVPIGTAHTARRIVVAVMFDATDDYPPASVTIGGVGATLVISESSVVALYIATVPTGTTADIVVTYASAATRSAIGVWRIDGLTSNTAFATSVATSAGIATASVSVPAGGVVISAARNSTSAALGLGLGSGAEDFTTTIEAARAFAGASEYCATAQVIATNALGGGTSDVVIASWQPASGIGGDTVTYAKNNKSPTADQVLCTPGLGAFTFTTSVITLLNVNSEIPNSVCFGEGYFFFTTASGLCYASGLNATTVNSLDVVRCEAKAEALVRGVFFDGELWLFGLSHGEVFGSGGSPNATGFPLNRTTVFWRGLIAPLAICGFEEGMDPTLVFVADDNSVRQMQGYNPVKISPPDLDRAIEDCTSKSSIRAFSYNIDGHACIVIDLGAATWVFDLAQGSWHKRKSYGYDYWRLTGNSVKAFGKWIAGDHLSGNLYQIDDTVYTEAGSTLSAVAESIAMEAFPQRLQVARVDFNMVAGVGTSTTTDPKMKIQWSDDGGHTWSDPVSRKLGESGKYKQQIRINGVGLTGIKGRRWRVTVDDGVYFGLLGGDMQVTGRPS